MKEYLPIYEKMLQMMLDNPEWGVKQSNISVTRMNDEEFKDYTPGLCFVLNKALRGEEMLVNKWVCLKPIEQLRTTSGEKLFWFRTRGERIEALKTVIKNIRYAG